MSDNNKSSNPTVSMAQIFLTYPQCTKQPNELQSWLQQLPNYECSIISHEQHHETEGDHLHAWVKFSRRRNIRGSTLQKFFDWEGYHPNIQLVRNTIADKLRVIKYVTKDGDYLVDNCDVDALLGKKRERKYNTKRLLETPIQELVENGEVNPVNIDKLYRCQQLWRIISTPHIDAKDVRGIWLYGPAGIGKTHAAREFAVKHGGLYIKAQNKWWDGYGAEKVVVLDDLDCEALCHYLKIWADKWACSGEMKGATVPLHHDYLIVTSNYTLTHIVAMKKGDEFDHALLEALVRRFRVLDWSNYSSSQEHFECRNIEEALGMCTPEECAEHEGNQSEKDLAPPSPKKDPTNARSQTPQIDPLMAFSGSGYGPINDDIPEMQTENIPKEPDLEKTHTETAPVGVLNEFYGKEYRSQYEQEKLPKLASEKEKESKEKTKDSLDEFCDTTSVDWEALHAAARNDPSYTMSAGCEEGYSYDQSGESEPSCADNL